MASNAPNFEKLSATKRKFATFDGTLVGPTPTIALTPVADGRVGAYEDNVDRTWAMTQRVYDLITSKVKLPDGRPVRVVVAPEIVYGPRTGAIAQKYYAEQNVGANIWISRSWSYSDELMSAAAGVGSTEWIQAAYGLNQTDRPGAVWLKAFTAAMDEKKRPIFCIYSPDLEDETKGLNDFVTERLVRFARCAAAVMYMRGKNYLSIGSVSMGIIGSDVRRNMMEQYLGMGSVSVDMVALRGRMDKGLFDHEELAASIKFFKKFKMDFGPGNRPQPPEKLIEDVMKMTLIVRDLMIGNPRLADSKVAKAQGFVDNVELAQGANAIASGTQGQRQWTDLYPNFDVAESLLNSSFGWEGPRTPFIVATENDSKNAIGMLAAHLLTGGMPQLFADIRTNWTPESIKAATGKDVTKICPQGIIDKRNSGAGALDYAVNALEFAGKNWKDLSAADAWDAIRSSSAAHNKLVKAAMDGTTYMGAGLTYFPGDGLSSHYRTPGGVPMTAYRYNAVGDMLTCSIVEGETVELPVSVADHISRVTDKTWPESYWTPRGMSSFEYMSRIGPNHDANSFGLIGADMITFNAMLRIPVDMHNVCSCEIFRPTMWDRFGGDDYRACQYLGALYA
ncbi:MAG: hypothetical protein LLG01_05660 [Planctomycetaceae bacterium]|nr:hypothetical protein [Planctomycetaceae bacterium]